MANDPLSITSPDSLEAFLRSLSEEHQKQAAAVLAHRIALRALPGIGGYRATKGSHVASVFLWTLFESQIAKVGCSWISYEIAAAANRVTAYNIFAAPSHPNVAGIARLTTRSAVRAVSFAAQSEVSYSISASSAAARVAVSTNLSPVWYNIVRDAADILSIGVTNVLLQPLWVQKPDYWQPQINAFRNFLAELDIESATHPRPWQVWWEWYEPIVEGKAPWGLPADIGTALERRIALGDNRKDFWDRDPHVVTAEIHGWVEEARASVVGASEQDGFEDIVEDLQSRAASIETVVRDGRVDVLHHAPNADISRSTLQSAVNDLALALKDMASSARAANADSRTCNFVEDLSTVVSDMLDDQTKLFQAARGAKALENYAPTVNAEWNSLAAAQYLSLVTQFDETLRKFPAWREFRKSKPEQVEQIDVRKADEGFWSFVKGLKDHAAFVANAVYEGLENLGRNLGKFAKKADDLAEEARQLEGQGELLLADVATSISNILQSGAKLVYDLCLKPFGNGVKETLPSESKKLGENIVKWTFRGGPLAAFAAAFPDVFSWLGSFAQWLKNLKG